MLRPKNQKAKDRRNNISNVLRNLKPVFTGVCFHYDSESKSEPEFEESIAEKTKLRRQRSDKIVKIRKDDKP